MMSSMIPVIIRMVRSELMPISSSWAGVNGSASSTASRSRVCCGSILAWYRKLLKHLRGRLFRAAASLKNSAGGGLPSMVAMKPASAMGL